MSSLLSRLGSILFDESEPRDEVAETKDDAAGGHDDWTRVGNRVDLSVKARVGELMGRELAVDVLTRVFPLGSVVPDFERIRESRPDLSDDEICERLAREAADTFMASTVGNLMMSKAGGEALKKIVSGGGGQRD